MSESRLTRRTLLQRAGALTVVASSGSLLSACGGTKGSTLERA